MPLYIRSPFLRKYETSMDSIKIRLDKKLRTCRDPQAVIPQMNRIAKECEDMRCRKSDQDIADELYSYLSNRFDTLQWTVLTHRCEDYQHPTTCKTRYRSFSHPLGTHYESDCLLSRTPCFTAISFSLDRTISSLFDEHTFKGFLKQTFLRAYDNYEGKLNYIALPYRYAAIKSNPKIPYFRLNWAFQIDWSLPSRRSKRYKEAPMISMRWDSLETFNIFVFPSSSFDGRQTAQLIKNVAPTSHYHPITNRYNKVVSVKDDYRWGWQWVWQEIYQKGRMGQLWKYTKDRQLVNKFGMCLKGDVRGISNEHYVNDAFYVYQVECNNNDFNQEWDIASNGKIFSSRGGCLHSKQNVHLDKQWLLVSKEACSWGGSSETWKLSY